MKTRSLTIPFPENEDLEGIIDMPSTCNAGLLLSHGAGAGMDHPFMEQLAGDFAKQNIGVMRFNFPFITAGRKRPDHPTTAKKAINAAFREFREQLPGIPLFMGGKSFGGRMMSSYAAENNTDKLAGLIFFGFPLHTLGKESMDRAGHLHQLEIPMLFLQGTRDRLANIDLMMTLTASLRTAHLKIISGADHSFKMLKKTGIAPEDTVRSLVEHTTSWMSSLKTE